MKKYSLGIDIGYSAVKVAIIDEDKKVVFSDYHLHKGQVEIGLKHVLNIVNEDIHTSAITNGAITGSIGKQIFNNEIIQGVNEVASIIEGTQVLLPKVKSIIEIGGQNARYYSGIANKNQNRSGTLQNSTLQISSNSDCAAGTGSFLEEQASRLNIAIEDYSEHVQKAKSIPRIAGRCSVFAKTDIIHHQQEGVPAEDILKGVAYAIIKNYKGAVIRRLPVASPIAFVGGVAKNQAIIDVLRDVLQKDEQELVVSENSEKAGAVGAAIMAAKDNLKLNFEKFVSDFSVMNGNDTNNSQEESLICLNKLPIEDLSSKHKLTSQKSIASGQPCFLGIDIGSTSTNLVLVNSKSTIVNYTYIRTKGNPLKAVQEGMMKIKSESGNDLNISGVGITGSGRHLIGKQLGADIIRDEITAQAKAAIEIDPEVDTIFEIGGQDSKFISISNGAVIDFQMNKVCAAGTGSFLDEQAQEFNIPVEDLEQLAFKGTHPASLGERCTVFIKSAIASGLSREVQKEDIVAGLCYSIAKNYLHRVVGQKRVGNKIMLQGGIAFNRGVANAFRILTGKPITTTPFFSVTGALGAALMACEEMINKPTTFIGIEKLQMLSQTTRIEVQPCKKIPSNFHRRIEETIFKNYDNTIAPEQKTVGIPRALFTYGMFPMFNAIFKKLGFNVLLSDWSNENTIKLGQEYAMEETCFPVKLILGHVAELVSKGVDYIFFPDLYTIDHPGSESRKNFGCAYMQLAFKIVNHTMELEKKGIKLLAPTFAFSLGGQFMKQSFSNLGELLEKRPEETGIALKKGMEAYHSFEERMEINGKKAIGEIDQNKISFVIISKMYGVADPILNLGIPGKLEDMGYQVIPFFDLPEGVNLGKEHPNMFWPFGQHILEPAYLIREHPNMYPVLLTHHGCGPDSVLLHYFKEIMGNKPYLNIEIDEHASDVGVITRLEAFINSLKISNQGVSKNIDSYMKKISYRNVKIKQRLSEIAPNTKVYIPNIHPYSELIKEMLSQDGYGVEILRTDADSIDAGRKHTLTNEYYSLTSLLGSCLNAIEQVSEEKDVAFLIPQTEGAEVEGQYNRIVRTKLDENKYKNTEVIAPYFEDFILLDNSKLQSLFYCILAGDIINVALPENRRNYLELFKKLIQDRKLDLANVKKLTHEIYTELKEHIWHKRVMAIGEPMVVFNSLLNDFTFKELEEQNNKVVYGALSEAVWLLWHDYVEQNSNLEYSALNEKLLKMKSDINQVSMQLKEESPFTPDSENLKKQADATIGYYAGAFARYRQAKVLCNSVKIDGIITATSLYENTGVSLNILHKGFSKDTTKPILNLTFDGNKNENNRSKVESFIYYL